MTFAAVPLPKLEPGSPEWMSKMTASKVAAVLGLSPWESRFSLWHKMAGLVEHDSVGNDATRRGHYLEDGVARWFADQHPEFTVEPGKAWAHRERDWQAASPDRLLLVDVPREGFSRNLKPAALLEIKTAASDVEWGEPFTDEIPPYYRAQVVWQMDTLGIPVCYVAVLLGGLRFAEYRVDYNADEAVYIRGEAKAFMDSLPGGPAEQRPGIDDHSETYVALKAINPDIDGDIEVPDELAVRWCQAVTAKREAESAHDLARNELVDYMGTARRAMWLGKSIATRQRSRSGDPFIKAATRLPVSDNQEPAA